MADDQVAGKGGLRRRLTLAFLLVGLVPAAIVGFLAIRGLIRYLGRAGFGLFFAYRVALAGLIAWRIFAR